MMSSLINVLFQDLIDEAIIIQRRIDDIETEERNIKTKKAILQNAINDSVSQSDKSYFILEYEKLKDLENELINEKIKKQETHRDLIRRVDIIQNSVKKHEVTDV